MDLCALCFSHIEIKFWQMQIKMLRLSGLFETLCCFLLSRVFNLSFFFGKIIKYRHRDIKFLEKKLVFCLLSHRQPQQKEVLRMNYWTQSFVNIKLLLIFGFELRDSSNAITRNQFSAFSSGSNHFLGFSPLCIDKFSSSLDPLIEPCLFGFITP
jgi:hypothetical protein